MHRTNVSKPVVPRKITNLMLITSYTRQNDVVFLPSLKGINTSNLKKLCKHAEISKINLGARAMQNMVTNLIGIYKPQSPCKVVAGGHHFLPEYMIVWLLFSCPYMILIHFQSSKLPNCFVIFTEYGPHKYHVLPTWKSSNENCKIEFHPLEHNSLHVLRILTYNISYF